MKIIIHTDGGARGNPGPAGIGVVIENEKGEKLAELSEYIGETTNNVAEYEALIRGLQKAKELLGARLYEAEVEVRMDSELVVRQLEGAYKVRDAGMRERFERVMSLRFEDFPSISFRHVRREQNAHADELVNRAIDLGAPRTAR